MRAARLTPCTIVGYESLTTSSKLEYERVRLFMDLQMMRENQDKLSASRSTAVH
jgi:hypothetical protein